MIKRIAFFLGVLVAVSVTAVSPVAADELRTCYRYDDSHNAIAACTRLIRSNAYHRIADVFSARGVAYRWIGNYDLAILDFDDAIRLDPRHSIAYGQRGIAYMQKGNRQQALRDLQTAVDIDPNNQTARNLLREMWDGRR